MSDQIRAKVFISCGQRKQTDEVEIAEKIGNRLSELGYEPYIATQQQTPRGLKDNIFAELESSEYFLFIDFKREQLDSKGVYRGSLFSHQELALASYLDIQLIAFQENGVNPRDGLLSFLQANPVTFTDRSSLPDLVIEQVKSKWNSNWQNRLLLKRESRPYVEVPITVLDSQSVPRTVIARYFHITVSNLNPRKMAINCYAYLEKTQRLTTSGRQDIPLKTIEFKWEGYMMPYAVIGAAQERSFDAFYVRSDIQDQIRFTVVSDSADVIPKPLGVGEYLLTYVVISENFPVARQTFHVHVCKKQDELQFEEATS